MAKKIFVILRDAFKAIGKETLTMTEINSVIEQLEEEC